MKKDTLRSFLLLHGALLIFSLSSVCSKLAAGQTFLSLPFILLYGGVIFLLGVYALLWQQVIKRLPLTLAFANKAITVLWGMIWGLILFGEQLTWGKVLGGLLIVGGILLFVQADREKEAKD